MLASEITHQRAFLLMYRSTSNEHYVRFFIKESSLYGAL
jgi:hypothetical protein